MILIDTSACHDEHFEMIVPNSPALQTKYFDSKH